MVGELRVAAAGQPEVHIRHATDGDVEAVRDLFVTAYGQDYPFKQFYDASWLKAAVFDEETVFLVASQGERILGTVSVMLSAGSLSDLIGEFGRLVVHPDARGRSLANHLFGAAAEEVSSVVQFGFAEGRTAHSASQKVLERCGFVAVGFEPLKYKLLERESVVMYGRLFGHTPDLRRNHPRLIPEIAPLAMSVLEHVGSVPDVVVADEEDGYPIPADDQAGDEVEVEDLSEDGWSPLLRIERGRVKGREVFGNLSLSHGFFKIRTRTTRYLVARQDGAVLGGLGFTHDPIDQRVRIFELIGINDEVKGRLLGRAEGIAREELGALYLEVDVSAYLPAIQRTLERMGFMAVAYCPSMVFEDVERLDVVRMAKLMAPYFHEDIPLTDSAARMRDLVERSMEDRREGNVVAQVASTTDLFDGLGEGDMYHLARLGRLRRVQRDEVLIRQGEAGDRLFIVVSGAMRVAVDGSELGAIGPGETAGEMALLDEKPRSADVIAAQDGEVVEIRRADLLWLMDRRPRLGATVMHNLATDLAGKLRKADVRFADAAPRLRYGID